MSLTEILLSVAFPLLVGVGLALAMATGGSATEFWIARIAFTAAALDVTGLILWWPYNSELSWWKIAIGIAVAAGSLVIALPAVLRWIDIKQADVIAAARQPEVTLRFVYPQGPVLQLINTSDKTAWDIKFMVVVWNKDLPDRLARLIHQGG